MAKRKAFKMFKVTTLIEDRTTLKVLKKYVRDFETLEQAIEFYCDSLLSNKSDEYRKTFRDSNKTVHLFLDNDDKIIDHRYFVRGHYA